MTEQSLKPKSARFEFIDILRGLSVLWMIEAHLTDVVLSPELKQNFVFYLIDKSNGFVATIFLFCAGAGFYIATSRKFDDYKKFRKPLWIYLRKLAFILFIAFSMHLPVRNFTALFNLSNGDFIRFVECDILNTIVYSSLLSLLIFFVIPKINYLKYISIGISLVIYYSTSFVWAADPFQHLHPFFATWFAEWPISHFPITPWMGHFFAGLAVTSLFIEAEDKKKFSLRLGIISILLAAFLLLFKEIPILNYPYVNHWWLTSPSHFIFRISFVIFLFSFLYYFEDYFKNKFYTHSLVIMGRESLLLYVGNVVLIYGSIINPGIRQLFPHQVGFFITLLLFIGLTTLLYQLSKGWHYLKIEKPIVSKIIIYTLSILFILMLYFDWYNRIVYG